MAVMDNLMQNIDRRAVDFKSTFDHLYCSNYPCAETTRLSEYHLHLFHPEMSQTTPMRVVTLF